MRKMSAAGLETVAGSEPGDRCRAEKAKKLATQKKRTREFNRKIHRRSSPCRRGVLNEEVAGTRLWKNILRQGERGWFEDTVDARAARKLRIP